MGTTASDTSGVPVLPPWAVEPERETARTHGFRHAEEGERSMSEPFDEVGDVAGHRFCAVPRLP